MNLRNKRVYLSAPLRASSEAAKENSILKVKEYDQILNNTFQCEVIAPHLLFYGMYDDNIPTEREKMLEEGLKLLRTCDAMVICSDRITDGMLREMIEAAYCRIPAFFLCESEDKRQAVLYECCIDDIKLGLIHLSLKTVNC